MKNFNLTITLALFAIVLTFSHLNYQDNQKRLDFAFDRINNLQFESYINQANHGNLNATESDLKGLGLDDETINYLFEIDLHNQHNLNYK